MKIRWASLASALLLLLVSVLPASAAPVTQSQAIEAAIRQEAATAEKVAPFVAITAQGITVDRAGARKAGIRPDVIASYAAAYERINSDLNAKHFDWAQLLKDIDSHQVYSTGSDVSADATYSRTWQWEKWVFTESETQLIASTLNGPGVIGALLGLLKSLHIPSWFTAAAIIAAFAGWYIDYIDKVGGNVGIYAQHYFGTGVSIVWHN